MFRGLFRAIRTPFRSPEPVTRRLGRDGERLAEKTLRRAGYRILGRNLRVPMGEADLLCLAPDRRTIVLVEVKTRIPGDAHDPSNARRPPEASVTSVKRAKLRQILRHLIAANHWHDRPSRIDVVAIDWPQQTGAGTPTVRHYPDAVDRRG